jgi:hypothetical protein
MEFPIVAGLILSVVVRHWPGQPAPQWIGTWTDRLWVLLAVTFLAGSALSFYNMTSEVLPNSGYRYSVSRPQAFQYALIAFYVPLVALALVGAGCIVRSAAGAGLARARNAWSSDSDRTSLFKLGASLVVALGALAVGVMLGGSLTITGEGVSNVWPFVIEVLAATVLFLALASAWSAAKGLSRKQES